MSKVKLTITYFTKDKKTGHYKDIRVDGYVDDTLTTQRTFDNTAELTKFVDDVTKYYNGSVIELTNFSVNPFKLLTSVNRKHNIDRKEDDAVNIKRILIELNKIKKDLDEIKDKEYNVDLSEVNKKMDGVNSNLSTLVPNEQHQTSSIESLKQQLYAIKQQLDKMEEKEDTISANQYKNVELLKEYMDNLNVKNIKEFKEVYTKVNGLYSELIDGKDFDYPSSDNPLAKSFFSDPVTNDKEAYQRLIEDSMMAYDYDRHTGEKISLHRPSILSIDYNETYINALNEHLPIINSLRQCFEDTLNADWEADPKKVNEASETMASALAAGAFVSSSSSAGLCAGVFMPIATAVGICKPLLRTLRANTKVSQFSREYADEKSIFTNKYRTLADEVAVFPAKDVLTDPDKGIVYASDIKLFVVNVYGAFKSYTLSSRDKSTLESLYADYFEGNNLEVKSDTTKKLQTLAEHKRYFPYVADKLTYLPIIYDEVLFSFCVYYYIAPYMFDTVNKGLIKDFTDEEKEEWKQKKILGKLPFIKDADKGIKTGISAIKYGWSATELDLFHTEINLMINAYFAAKRTLASPDEIEVIASITNSLLGYQKYYNEHNDNLGDSNMLIKFLAIIKLGLMIQGVNIDRADYLVRQLNDVALDKIPYNEQYYYKSLIDKRK